MNPIDFLSTICWHDNALKGFSIDSWNDIVKFHMDGFARIKGKLNEWGFSDEGIIDDGWLVFEKVSYFSIIPAGVIPNDNINISTMTNLGDGHFSLEFDVYSCTKKECIKMQIKIICDRVHIETLDGEIINN